MSPLSTSELSLCGLIARLREVEHLKTLRSLEEEQQAKLQTEAEVKKALMEELQAATSGLASFEKKLAKEFLQTQIKSIDDTSKGADVKRAKLQELLSGIEAAAAREDPSHVRRARLDLGKAEKSFEEATKNYERWEKGKKMFSVDEIKALKRAYEDGKQKLEKARGLLEEQQQRRAAAAVGFLSEEKERGAAAVATEARLARAKAMTQVVAKANPGVSTKGYPKQPPPAALRQAQLAAQVRADAEPQPEAPPPPREPRRQAVQVQQPQDAPVLSYACTCTAVAELCGVSEAQAREMAVSAGDFARHFEGEQWQAIQDRSLAIEKANREKQREAERRKQQKALAKVTNVESSATNGAMAKAVAKGLAVAPKVAKAPPVAKAVPKEKPEGKAKPKSTPLTKLAVANRFGAMESDDEEGWTAVKR